MDTSNIVCRIGFRSGIVAGAAMVSYVIVQMLQLLHVLSFPWDDILIYGTSLCIVVPFALAMLALHYITPVEKQFYTHSSLFFTFLYAVFVIANYVVQLATVVPARIEGKVSEIQVLVQSPHSLFWDFDALGYICMGLAMAVALPALRKQGIQRWTRLAFLSNAAVTPLIAIVYFYPGFSERLLILGFPWAIIAPAATFLLGLTLLEKSPIKARRNSKKRIVHDQELYELIY